MAAESQPNDVCANLDVREFSDMTGLVIYPTLQFYKGTVPPVVQTCCPVDLLHAADHAESEYFPHMQQLSPEQIR